jgi:iron complex outermembrane receptor protein
MTGISKPVNGSFQNNFANQLQDKTFDSNFNRVEFGTYGVSYDLSDSFSIDTGLRYDYSRVDAAKFYLKSRWEERGYAAEFADFIVGEEGNQWLAKPSFTFHNVSVQDSIKNLPQT